MRIIKESGILKVERLDYGPAVGSLLWLIPAILLLQSIKQMSWSLPIWIPIIFMVIALIISMQAGKTVFEFNSTVAMARISEKSILRRRYQEIPFGKIKSIENFKGQRTIHTKSGYRRVLFSELQIVTEDGYIPIGRAGMGNNISIGQQIADFIRVKFTESNGADNEESVDKTSTKPADA